MEKKPYAQPEPGFGHKDFEPYIMQTQQRIHHRKLHAALKAILK
jgi:hypothetical protein